MFRNISLAALLLLDPTIPVEATATQSRPAALEIQRFGLFVVSDNLVRSTAFYEDLFGRPPQVRTAGLVGFDVNGAFYAVADRQTYAVAVRRGDNVVPYLKVADIDAWFAHASTAGGRTMLSPAVLREGPFSHFKLADPDGNIVEFYSVGERHR